MIAERVIYQLPDTLMVNGVRFIFGIYKMPGCDALKAGYFIYSWSSEANADCEFDDDGDAVWSNPYEHNQDTNHLYAVYGIRTDKELGAAIKLIYEFLLEYQLAHVPAAG